MGGYCFGFRKVMEFSTLHRCARWKAYINLQCPNNSGSYYYNYKGQFSIVLLGVVDAYYKFRYIDVGCNGRVSDGGVFRNSILSPALSENSINIPTVKHIPGYPYLLPYVIVEDDAFPLKHT